MSNGQTAVMVPSAYLLLFSFVKICESVIGTVWLNASFSGRIFWREDCFESVVFHRERANKI